MMKLSKTLKFAGAQATIFYSMAVAALAQAVPLPDPGIGDNNLLTFVNRVLKLAISLAALLAAGYLIYSGIQYILAAGDEGKVEKATKGITYSVIGLVIAFISVLIVNYVLSDVIKKA